MAKFPLTCQTAPVPQVTVHVISDSAELRHVEQVWDRLVVNQAENPFLLAGFVKEFMDLRRPSGWEPLLLLLFADEVPVGLVPLATKRVCGIRVVDFLIPPVLGPDFVVEDRFREASIAKVVRLLFEHLHCQFVHLTLPAQSANLPILKETCAKSVRLWVRGERSGHYVLPVRGSWKEFESSRGSNFRSHFKKAARNLGRTGSWRIVSSDELAGPQDVMKRILHVEEGSWKEDWRRRSGQETDEHLFLVWRGLTYTSGRARGFLWKVYFLELNGETIAYNLVLHCDQSAFMVKMSFNDRYRNLYPGTFLANQVVRDIFSRQSSRSIDFLTSLPFLKRWAPRYLGRVAICVCPRGILPTALASMMMSTFFISVLDLASRAAWRLGFASALRIPRRELE